jgi:nucleotide-binding universal stress UspA family protein
MNPVQRILVPLDFSPHSNVVLDYAAALAAQCSADLHVIHVLIEQMTAVPAFEMGLAFPTTMKEHRTVAERTLNSQTDSIGMRGLTIVRSVVDGTAAEKIADYARQFQIDLIVMGTHGRSGLSHLLMGSVAESVLRNAPCPVLTIRPGNAIL